MRGVQKTTGSSAPIRRNLCCAGVRRADQYFGCDQQVRDPVELEPAIGANRAAPRPSFSRVNLPRHLILMITREYMKGPSNLPQIVEANDALRFGFGAGEERGCHGEEE